MWVQNADNYRQVIYFVLVGVIFLLGIVSHPIWSPPQNLRAFSCRLANSHCFWWRYSVRVLSGPDLRNRFTVLFCSLLNNSYAVRLLFTKCNSVYQITARKRKITFARELPRSSATGELRTILETRLLWTSRNSMYTDVENFIIESVCSVWS